VVQLGLNTSLQDHPLAQTGKAWQGMFMIGSLKGLATAIGDDRALIEVQGVGYLVQAGARTLGRLRPGAPALLYVETQLREDSLKLYGFGSDSERAWFVRLQDIPGVGAKVALAVLDVLTPGELMQAAELDDRASIGRANGVGPKLAARIAQELKGRAPPQGIGRIHSAPGAGEAGTSGAADPVEDDTETGLAPGTGLAARAEALSALANLGISQPEALRAVAQAGKALGPEAPVAALVKAALKEINR
jgi:holliday junction DNA helicase RuvA